MTGFAPSTPIFVSYFTIVKITSSPVDEEAMKVNALLCDTLSIKFDLVRGTGFSQIDI